MPYIYEFNLRSYTREGILRADYDGRRMVFNLGQEIKDYEKSKSLVPQEKVKFKINAANVRDIDALIVSELIKVLSNYSDLPIMISNLDLLVSFKLRDAARDLRTETQGFNLKKEGLELVLE